MTSSLAQRVSAAAHDALPHANPLSVDQVEALIRSLAAPQPRTALDIGCGPGSLAIALAALSPTAVTAIDNNVDFLARGRQSARARPLLGSVSFEHRDAAHLGEQEFDAVLCVGSSQAFGSTLQALRRCASLLHRGGTLLFADLVWSAPPDDSLLSFLGVERSVYWDEHAERDAFDSAGLSLIEVTRASTDSWNSYEARIHRGRLEFAATLPQDDGEQARARAVAWAEAYRTYGQYCLGFNAYLARQPGPETQDVDST